MRGLPGLIGLQMEERGLLDLGAQPVAGFVGFVDRLLIGGLLAHFPGVETMKIAPCPRRDGHQQRASGKIALPDHALMPAL